MKKLIKKIKTIIVINMYYPFDGKAYDEEVRKTSKEIAKKCKKFTIAFGEWLLDNKYEPIHDNRWCKQYMSFTHSTEELFNNFIKEKYGKTN